MSNLTIKIQHCQDIHRVSVPKEIAYSELLKITKGLFRLVSRTDWSNLSMKYTDTEDDMITISNTEV
jgi:hypothetical protein